MTPCFNPRLRAGGDCRGRSTRSPPLRFNPRLRAGGDMRGTWLDGTGSTFQSTPPRGRRPGNLTCSWHHPGFNPRLRAGGDLHFLAGSPEAAGVSIHASAREATSVLRPTTRAGRSFNPRLRAGGDMPQAEGCWSLRCFNPRLRAGGDSGSRLKRSRRWRFQSTPPRGRRPEQGATARPGDSVSIHASAREATYVRAEPAPFDPVSIHASAREATGFRRRVTAAGSSFNPRLRAGGD